ncbi:MAG TPA: KAP family NTPase [Alphaproteobacteria bacterium]
MTESAGANYSVSAPERPIKTLSEDKLEREAFVSRLVNALINPKTKRSTGVVVGITGPWGSGKTSLLNLLDERIQQQYENAIVVRFNPWLISGRNDLIGEFIAELVASINSKPSVGDRLRDIASTVAKYGAHVSPVANLFMPGLSDAAEGVCKAAEEALKRDKSLHKQREDVTRELQEIDAPIVVFIDELDRVEDNEVRTVAQLVRSIADFPSISYVLAYDAERVIEALGGGAPERGRSYLEKIVQLQIPLPIVLPEELKRLLCAEIGALQVGAHLPRDWSTSSRFLEILDLLVPSVIETPRDVKRVVGTFHVYASMLAEEVDWVDLLAFSALAVKAPRTVEHIRRAPESVVEDPVSYAEHMRRMRLDKKSDPERMSEIHPKEEGGIGIERLLSFIFPSLASHRRPGQEELGADAICLRRPLLTTLRLGLLPGNYSRWDVINVLSKREEEIIADLKQMHASDTLAAFLDRLGDVYPTLKYNDDIKFWSAVAKFLEKPDCQWWTAFDIRHSLPRTFEQIFAARIKKEKQFNAKEVFHTLLSGGTITLPAELIRSQIFIHGLFGYRARPEREGEFLSATEAQSIAEKLSATYKKQHLTGAFVSCLWNLAPVYTMIDCGAWDDACRKRMLDLLQDPVALDGFTLQLYGPGYGTSAETVEKIVGYESLKELIGQRLENLQEADMHETVWDALHKALDGIWGR